MEWFSIKDKLPEPNTDVLVTDGYGGCAVAEYNRKTKKWYANEDLLDDDNYAGLCSISIDSKKIHFWTNIDTESCPMPDWSDNL